MYFFALLGFLVSLYVLLKSVYLLAHNLSVYICLTYPSFSKYGEWSVITGSTDGIGKAMAFELASRGQKIILISRNKDKLIAVSSEIESKFGVETKYLQIDFGQDEKVYQTIKEFLKDVDVGVLINNVGTTGHAPEYFLDIPNLSDVITNITRINITSVLKRSITIEEDHGLMTLTVQLSKSLDRAKMTQIVLPGMEERKRGLIINVSSGIAKVPAATLASYGASKSFVEYFSHALSYEYEAKGIIIQCCLPGLVSTKLAKSYDHQSFFSTTPQAYARSALATVEKERVTFGWWRHALRIGIFRCLPLKMLNNYIKRRTKKAKIN